MKKENISFYSQDATHRLIMLHGWGADANDLIPLGEKIIKTISLKMELLSLNAPELHPQGFGRQWYGLFPSDWSAVPNAIEKLSNRLQEIETHTIPLNRTFLLGFSQGGAMALATGCDLPFAGLICCSAYPHPGWSPPSVSPPILLAHGDQDNIVPLDAFTRISNLLKINRLTFQSELFNGSHEIPDNITYKICNFIEKYI